MIENILTDAFIDTARMTPLLLIIYIGIELFEFKFGAKIKDWVIRSAKSGPVAGAIAGAFPQCGFSVIATVLYTQRLATIGTLLAVYLSTSDEAIPILLSDPRGIPLLMPLIATKIIIAVIAGYTIDLAFKKNGLGVLAHIKSLMAGKDAPEHHHEIIADEKACCGHLADSTSKRFNPKEILLHPAIHTAKILIFIFIISAILGFIVETAGSDALKSWFADAILWQPVIAALIGLIPNCAASVAITEFYLDGVITYGAALAGLCASGGLGLLVLVREEKERKNIFLVIGLLFSISILIGYLL